MNPSSLLSNIKLGPSVSMENPVSPIPPLRWKHIGVGFGFFGQSEMRLEYFDGQEWKPVPLVFEEDVKSEPQNEHFT